MRKKLEKMFLVGRVSSENKPNWILEWKYNLFCLYGRRERN
jgi:hypothetical protein